MDPLRIVLFLGLVSHKVVWEVLKNRDAARTVKTQSAGFVVRWFVKPAKVLALGFFALQTLFLDLLPITDDPYGLRIWGTTLYFIGLVTAVLGRVQLGKNWVDLEDYQVLTKQSVTTTGIYRYIRHPIYTGDIFLLIGLELALNSWLVLGVPVIIPIVVRQVLLEEAILAKAFPHYRDYVLSTRRFIPFVV